MKIPIPDGFVFPEEVSEGDEFDVVMTVRLNGPDLELVKIDGNDIPSEEELEDVEEVEDMEGVEDVEDIEDEEESMDLSKVEGRDSGERFNNFFKRGGAGRKSIPL